VHDSRTRDQDLEGTHVGTHAKGCRYSQDGSGGLNIFDQAGELIAQYPAAEYSVTEGDSGEMHIRKLGAVRDPSEKRDPEPVTDAVGVVKLGESMPERLRQLNELATRKYGSAQPKPEPVRDRGPHVPPGRVYGAGDPAVAPGQQQADIRAMNAAAAHRYRQT